MAVPSGVSYVLENRRAMKRAFQGWSEGIGVRPVENTPGTFEVAEIHRRTGVADPRGADSSRAPTNSAI